MKNREKSILIAASMSAGKTSLINALLGRDLLPAGNEATTAKVARITVGEKARTEPVAKAYSLSGSIVASSETLCAKQIRAWNRSDEISAFDVVIPHSGSKLHSMLAGHTLIDTPGANNSRDYRHKEQFTRAIKAYPKSPILYVLNATQLGTTDDAEIIRNIREVNPRRPVIFVLNKVDALDEEKGETVKHYVSLTHTYLEGLGYTRARIIPLMAQPALIAKKTLNHLELGRAERHILSAELERFRLKPFHLHRAAVVPQVLKKPTRERLARISKGKVAAMSREELNIFIDYTGLSILSASIIDAV